LSKRTKAVSDDMLTSQVLNMIEYRTPIYIACIT